MLKDILKEEESKIPQLAFHTMTVCDKIITIYGGLRGKDKYSGDIYFIKMSNKSITKSEWAKNKSMFPSPRHSHSADYDSKYRRMFIFGGYSDIQPHFLNQLCILDLRTYPTIVFQSIRTLNITPRCCHTTFLDKRKLYIYGGYGISKETKQVSILNDFHFLDLDSGKITEVTSKGGAGMSGKIYKSCRLEPGFVFFSKELDHFYIFILESETFIKIDVKFSIPESRDYFSLNVLNDGRIIILGGSSNDKGFKDLHYLMDYTYEKEIGWVYSRMDIFGAVRGVFNGHCTILLDNSHILIHGGTERAFDPFNPESVKHQPKFSNRFQILNLDSSYVCSKENISNQTNNEEENIIDDKKEFKPIHNGSLMHILANIPKDDINQKPTLLLHGGERDNYILCKAYLYNLGYDLEENEERLTALNENVFTPQLKGHSWAPFWFKLNKLKQYYVVISGGVTISHTQDCKYLKSYEKGFNIKNELKETCGCENEDINSDIFIYSENMFYLVRQESDLDNNLLKRYGHSMVYHEELNVIYILCGFIQYSGYVFEMVKIDLKKDEKFNIKNQSGANMSTAMTTTNVLTSMSTNMYGDRSRHKRSVNKHSSSLSNQLHSNAPHIGLVCKLEKVDLESEIKGRVHAAVGICYNYIIIFGGYKDGQALNDFVLINVNPNLKKPQVNFVSLDPIIIYPRFGMSGVIHMDEFDQNVSRFIVFGGSFMAGDNLVESMTNEVLVFKFEHTSYDNKLHHEVCVPSIYGFSEKRVYHSAVMHENRVYVFGGLNAEFQVLELPSEVNYDIENCISEYELINPKLTYKYWEQGKLNKKLNLNISKFMNIKKNNSSKFSKEFKAANDTLQSGSKDKKLLNSPMIELVDLNSHRSKEKLLNGLNSLNQEEKSLISSRSSENISNFSNSITIDNKPLIEKKVNFLLDESELMPHKLIKKNTLELINHHDVKYSKPINSKINSKLSHPSSNDNSEISIRSKNKIFKKKEKEKTKNWDEDYD